MIKKEGHMIKNMKSRHFVLMSDGKVSTLKYYVKAKLTPPYGEDEKGSINLKGCEIQRTGKAVTLTAKDGHVLKLEFDNENEKESWISALRLHIAHTA